MADNMSKLSINPNLVGFSFYCKSLSSNLEKWQPFLWFWVMADIQDGWQWRMWSKHVQNIPSNKVSEVRFNLPRFNPRLKHLCVTFMHFKKVTKKKSQNRLKISCVKSSENRLGNSDESPIREIQKNGEIQKHDIDTKF